MKKRVVITGLGTVTAAGQNNGTFWQALNQGSSLFSPITRFDPASYRSQLAAEASAFNGEDWMPKPQTRKMDRSSQFALAAAHMALADSGIEPTENQRERTGIMVGNAMGGMDFAEPQFYNQSVHGPGKVSPHLVVAWFPVASQGRISIALGIKGYSKTFVTDRVSSLHAVGHAFRTIQDGKLDLCLAGGTEAPLVPFIYRALEKTGQLTEDGYRPFQPEPTGFLLGEGSAFLVMEEREHALSRSATILAEVKGYAMTTDPRAGMAGLSGPEIMKRAISLGLANAGVQGKDVGHVLADGAATKAGDAAEAVALKETLGDESDWTVSVPKTVVGELYGAGGAIQVAAGTLALHHQTVLPFIADRDISVPHSLVPQRRTLSHVLVLGRGLGGLNACLVLGSGTH